MHIVHTLHIIYFCIFFLISRTWILVIQKKDFPSHWISRKISSLWDIFTYVAVHLYVIQLQCCITERIKTIILRILDYFTTTLLLIQHRSMQYKGAWLTAADERKEKFQLSEAPCSQQTKMEAKKKNKAISYEHEHRLRMRY